MKQIYNLVQSCLYPSLILLEVSEVRISGVRRDAADLPNIVTGGIGDWRKKKQNTSGTNDKTWMRTHIAHRTHREHTKNTKRTRKEGTKWKKKNMRLGTVVREANSGSAVARICSCACKLTTKTTKINQPHAQNTQMQIQKWMKNTCDVSPRRSPPESPTCDWESAEPKEEKSTFCFKTKMNTAKASRTLLIDRERCWDNATAPTAATAWGEPNAPPPPWNKTTQTKTRNK
jgi:hypothetical protein